jgi:hypothetical protein
MGNHPDNIVSTPGAIISGAGPPQPGCPVAGAPRTSTVAALLRARPIRELEYPPQSQERPDRPPGAIVAPSGHALLDVAEELNTGNAEGVCEGGAGREIARPFPLDAAASALAKCTVARPLQRRSTWAVNLMCPWFPEQVPDHLLPSRSGAKPPQPELRGGFLSDDASLDLSALPPMENARCEP